MEVITRVKIKVSLIGQTNNKEGIRSCGGKHVLNMHHTCSRQQGQACMSRISRWKDSKKNWDWLTHQYLIVYYLQETHLRQVTQKGNNVPGKHKL